MLVIAALLAIAPAQLTLPFPNMPVTPQQPVPLPIGPGIAPPQPVPIPGIPEIPSPHPATPPLAPGQGVPQPVPLPGPPEIPVTRPLPQVPIFPVPSNMAPPPQSAERLPVTPQVAPTPPAPADSPISKFAFDAVTRPSPLPVMEQTATAAANVLKEYAFPCAAHIPLPRFGHGGEAVGGVGLIIYEGMTVRVQDTGEYEVQFTASTPNIEAVLRLQIVVHVLGERLTLTLPPIRIEAENGSANQPLTGSYNIVHRGYSKNLTDRLKQAGCRVGQSDLCPNVVTFERVGMARFGSVPRD